MLLFFRRLYLDVVPHQEVEASPDFYVVHDLQYREDEGRLCSRTLFNTPHQELNTNGPHRKQNIDSYLPCIEALLQQEVIIAV